MWFFLKVFKFVESIILKKTFILKSRKSFFPYSLVIIINLLLLLPDESVVMAQKISNLTFTPQSGDGIYKTFQKNGLTVKKIVEPLFGKTYEQVEIIDQQLKGAVFYLVSGHGGPDPGAMGKIGKNILCEDEYAYDVTLRFGRELIRHGAKVYFIVRDPYDGIRDELYLKNSKDEVCYPNKEIPLNQTERLKQRVDAINTLYRNEKQGIYKRCIEIHIDAREIKKNIDIFFYYHEGSKNGERLASIMRHSIEQKYQLRQPGRGYSGDVSKRKLYILGKAMPATILIELGNIHHARDQQRLIYENNRQALAKWMCDGVMEDFQKRNN